MLDVNSTLAMDVRIGLSRYPKTLPPKWLYDDAGSRLFDAITRLPEYYPTETERSILLEHADSIALLSAAEIVVELGSGTSDKTTTLLDAFERRAQLRTFVPIDVSQETLASAASRLQERYTGVAVLPLVGDFTEHLPALPDNGRRLLVFLGGTLGNFYPDARRIFLEHLSSILNPGDCLLIGTDLVKSADRLIAAYQDDQGTTERFIRNILEVINTQLGAEFDTATFEYIPFWDAPNHRMDLRLRSVCDQQVPVPGADLIASFSEGEEIRVEISTKFRVDALKRELESVGFSYVRLFTDANQDFALTLVRRGP